MTVGFPIVAVIVILVVLLLTLRQERVRRARTLKRAGFGVMAFFTAFFGLFIIGETFTDPGGWTALGLVAAWTVPLSALAAVAWYRPGCAARLFALLTVAVIGVNAWFAVNPQGWRVFEDRHGPIRMLVSFVLAAALAVLGLRRTAVAGVLLLVLGLVPVMVSSLGGALGFASLTVVSSAPFVTAVLYLWSAASAGGPVPSGSTRTEPEDRPQAA